MKYFFILIFAVILFVSVHIVITYKTGMREPEHKADLIVIRGTRVHEDGSPSDALLLRLNKGLSVYESGLAPMIMVSGGLGAEGHKEGDVMSSYLISKGVPPENIIIDNDGINTRSTATNAFKIANDKGYKSVIVVSQYFHILRCIKLFKKAGFK